MKKQSSLLWLFTAFFAGATHAQTWRPAPVPLQSRWAKQVSLRAPLADYPRPQLARSQWQNLNGLWSYAITDTARTGNSFPATSDGQILVPFAPESSLSGVGKIVQPHQYLWYKRQFQQVKPANGQRVLLHFGAVDQTATAFVNGQPVGSHSGGYTAFTFDITDALQSGQNELVVKVYDPTDWGSGPKGKQTLRPGNIYYTPSSGIWQTVWLETVPAQYIDQLVITPDIDRGTVSILAHTDYATTTPMRIKVLSKGTVIATRTGAANAPIVVSIPNAQLWSPEKPFLYDLEVSTVVQGKPVDVVKSYFGMRKVAISKDGKGMERIFLNNQPYYNLGVLDQGFWPDGLYTAPTDEALAFDIKVIKAMGFNTIRKHIKVEPARWYYHADRLGMLVWQDLVNPHGPAPAAHVAFEKESKEILDQLQASPSITTWVLFNERWGSYDQQRLTEWLQQADPSRIVNGHSGEYLYVNDQLREKSENPYVSSHLTDVHAYPEPRLPMHLPGQAMVLGEFGGVGVSVPYHQWDDLQGWGYVQVKPAELERRYAAMTKQLVDLKTQGLSASIYTQPFDVEGEENGLLTYDREYVKMPIDRIRAINSRLQPAPPLSFSTTHMAKPIDLHDTDDRYQELLQQYAGGKQDSAFLRRLALMAMRQKDQPMLTTVNNHFIDQLTTPFSKSNLDYIRKTTFVVQDKGFEIAIQDSARINAVLGPKASFNIIRPVLQKEFVDPWMASHINNPQWTSLRAVVAQQFGIAGYEYVSGEAMAYYLEREIWDSVAQYYFDYYSTAFTRSKYHINNMSWPIFEHVSDRKVLDLAIRVMEYDILHFDQHSASSFDTYANLLYKVGRREEAINWENKAVQLSNHRKSLVETLDKMKAGIPTW